jgi:hypothetical protein
MDEASDPAERIAHACRVRERFERRGALMAKSQRLIEKSRRLREAMSRDLAAGPRPLHPSAQSRAVGGQ